VRRRTPRAVKRERQAAAAALRADMPLVDCYLIAFAKTSSCDEQTSDLSLFQLVVRAKHMLSDFGLALPYTAVFFLETTEPGLEVEIRSTWVPRSDEAAPEPIEEPSPIVLNNSRTQLRRTVCRLPQAPGTYDLRLEWRTTIGDGRWQMGSAWYSVKFES
jgi:hypothetical protein